VVEKLQKRQEIKSKMAPTKHFNTLEDFLEGQVLVIDKPLDWTSFDVVNKLRGTIRHTFNIKKIKVGHAGTLDPLATGVLVVCTGRKTKTIDILQAEQKTYTGTIRLGVTTPSFDSETEVDNYCDLTILDAINPSSVEKASIKFIGNLNQMPPQYSAKKVDGVTAYKAARKGETVALKPKAVTVNSFEINSFNKIVVDKVSGVDSDNYSVIDVNFKVVCSKGTYIRALARDLGKELNVGGTLTALRRTRSGDFMAEKAWDLTELLDAVKYCGITAKNS
jgi:tRNA pseudouridine55 synthase|tara:strand:+ start:3194 stop:4027 length:834 start_codon:yes stop_codon:yes gene_type:complete